MAQGADREWVAEEQTCLVHWVSCGDKKDQNENKYHRLLCLQNNKIHITAGTYLRFVPVNFFLLDLQQVKVLS